jgi:Ca-activated chloride channel family protein
MFQFANPWFLLLALAAPLIVWWRLRQRRNALRHPSAALLLGLPAGRARAARWGGALLRALALLLLAVALAGPRWPDRRTRIETEGVALVLLVDVSGSMAEPDFDWRGEPMTRLDAVKRVFRLFVEGASGADPLPEGVAPNSFQGRATDLIGLVTFATRPETACPLTLSHSVMLRQLDAERPRSVPGDSETNLSDAIALGLHRLQSAGPRRKALLLLTDGEHNVVHPQSGWTPRQAAQVAGSLGVPIYTIDAGGTLAIPEAGAKETDTVLRTTAIQTLEDVARISHGRYFAAHDTAGLLAACRDIDALERADIQSFQYRRYHESYPWFALAAFGVCLGVLALEMTVWRRIP